MYYGESVQERGGSSNSWNNGSNMLLRHQHAVLIGFTLLIYSLQGYTNVQAVDQVITEKEGQTVVVPCPVNKDKCGELHSLNWFKGDNRIAAMLLDDSNVTSVAEGFEDRVSVEQNPFRLIIRNLEIADQDIYLCDTTYFIPIETCDNFNGHRVELKVLVPPSEMVIWDEKGDRIANGTVIGPMQERQMLNLTCVVRNTTPMPEVGWYRGSELLPEVDIHYDDKDGLFNVTVELYLKLTRKDLAHNIECRAKSAAIQNTLSTQFSIDLQVRPTNIHINGVEKYTVQGSKVVLTCSVYGARPPVNLTWYNSTQTIDPAENDLTEIRTKAIEQADGTFYTQSELLFNATRFENDKEFRCEAENIVVKMNGEKPFQALLGLEVFYPPVIDVNPLNATVNTGDSVLLYCDYVANPATLKSVLWYRNGVSLNVSDSDHYKGGNSEHVALSIRHAVKEDIGNYTCELTNEAGQGISEEQINLDVLYVPTVEVLMTPVDSVKESEEANVTLICKIIDANPPILTKVRWYANSTLLKELPDCEETKEDLCHIDPSKLLLESIGRGFFYNYSCEGYNDAGWGPRSEDKELLVLYEPGPATIAHFPLIAVKKKSVTFSCSVDDPGYPETNSFRWLRGGRASSSDTKDYTIEPVGLDSRTNYSCYAMNAGGKGAIATVNLEVHAPPFFIKNLPPYTGMLHTSRNANLTCRIECVPRCEISWLKDGVPIEKNDTRYFVKDKYMDASPATGDFESMLSVLHFNMSNWPNNKFDIEGDNANYTCISTGNAVGPGIKSATYFSIEYAPDNTTVSEEVVYVAEETTPGRVMCKSRANPEPTYEWHFNDKPLIQGSALIINTGMTRNESGRYTCVAFNKHGRSTAETVIDVQYKPRCEIERKEIDDQDTLICTAYGNPEEADFSWSIKAENESVEALGSGDSKTFKDKSYYVLKEDYEIARTYRCVANNTVGVGAFCEIEVAEQLAWWQRWDKPALIILVASILVLLLAVIIICCIIICICRRRRRQDKFYYSYDSYKFDHYKGGNSEHVALSIRHAVKEDIGNYTCELTNEAGQGISEEQINLDVLYVPTVEVLMTPVDSVKESEEANVTLICKIIDANPPILTKVRWYANSTLLKELPDCEETKEDLCHIDPSKLLLESIGRGFFYNYSCEGYNDAGWGPRSEDKELLVLYEPGPATIAHFPLIAVKKKSVTFSCSVDDPGYPETNSFRWLRGGRASSSDTKDYTIEPVGLDSRTNYSCYAMNAGGKGAIATVNLEVHAPPFFIKNLPPYTGMLHTSRNANLTCRIECVPRCEISWLKDGVPIEKNDTRYFVKDKYMDASPATGDFESMLSVLHFNMSNWPNNKFDIEGDNANYTCISTGNAVGPGIKSATYFSIEYAPDNTTVSEEVVYVAEETTPGRVMCKSRANPEPTYEWHFNDKPLIQGSALIINTGMTRNESGRYTCVAFNKHGRSTAETVIDVQYKPRCEIERKEIDDQDTLICTAYGNPEEADFSWSIKAENESVEALGSGDSKTFKDKSYYVLKEDYEIARTYRCVANNTVGVGAFCEIEVAEQLAWWQRWDKPALIILVASILVLLLAVIIICCIIICICRRRRRQDKFYYSYDSYKF
uniref:Ig-like domain-containing protein n=1 Tax=Stomoxys calcitrans TaxID=35570 RepID=A0A1I8PB93_STOCA